MENSTSPMDFFQESVNLGEDTKIMDTIEPEENLVEDELESDENEEDIEIPLEDEDLPEDTTEEEDVEGHTQAALLAKSFVEEGVLPDDFEYDENLTGADLKKALYENATSGLDAQAYFESLGYNEKTFEMASNIVNGVDPSMAYEANRYEAISKANLEENPEYAESILKLDFADKGLDESTIEDLVATKIERGEEIEAAKKVQEKFAQKAKDIISEQKEKVNKQAQKREDLKNQVIKSIEDKIPELSKRDKKELNEYIYKPTETVEQEINGKKVKNFVSKFKKDFDGIFTNPEEFAKFALNLKNGWDVTEKKKTSKLDAAVSTIDALNKRVSKSNKKPTKAKDIFADLSMI